MRGTGQGERNSMGSMRTVTKVALQANQQVAAEAAVAHGEVALSHAPVGVCSLGVPANTWPRPGKTQHNTTLANSSLKTHDTHWAAAKHKMKAGRQDGNCPPLAS